MESFDIIYFYGAQGGHPIGQIQIFSNVAEGDKRFGIWSQGS